MTTVLEKNDLQRVMIEKYLKPDAEYVSHHGYDIESINLEGLTTTVYDLLTRKAFNVSHSVNTVRKVDLNRVLDKTAHAKLSVEMVGDLDENIQLYFTDNGQVGNHAGISIHSDGFYIFIHQSEESPKAFIDMMQRARIAARCLLDITDVEDRDD